jgi:hypothetical protein
MACAGHGCCGRRKRDEMYTEGMARPLGELLQCSDRGRSHVRTRSGSPWLLSGRWAACLSCCTGAKASAQSSALDAASASPPARQSPSAQAQSGVQPVFYRRGVIAGPLSSESRRVPPPTVHGTGRAGCAVWLRARFDRPDAASPVSAKKNCRDGSLASNLGQVVTTPFIELEKLPFSPSVCPSAGCRLLYLYACPSRFAFSLSFDIFSVPRTFPPLCDCHATASYTHTPPLSYPSPIHLLYTPPARSLAALSSNEPANPSRFENQSMYPPRHAFARLHFPSQHATSIVLTGPDSPFRLEGFLHLLNGL